MEKTLDTQSESHPIRQEVRKLCGTYNLSATFSEDTGTLSTLKTPGLIAVQCILSKDGRPVGIGHGSSIISRINSGIERSIFSCINGSLMSAANSACSLDILRLENVYESAGIERDDSITDRQKSYLLELVHTNLTDEEEKSRWESQVDGLTKGEASEAIKSLRR
jgi:hypothetical protein